MTTKTYLGIALSESTTARNMSCFYLACFTAIMLATFVPATQPFLLSEVLFIPTAEQGSVSGNLSFLGEMVIIISVGFWGSISDKLGRHWVTALGYLLVALGVLLYGFARDYYTLLLARCIYSVGIAAVSAMLIALMADYAQNKSRGKATGYLGIMNGLGAMVTALFLLKLPTLFQGKGLNAEQAALATYGTMAVATLLVALLMYLGLRKNDTRFVPENHSILAGLRSGFSAAKDPGILLAYGASFVARGNLAVVGTFFTLWASLYGTAELGMSTAEAMGKGGSIVAISYIASLLSAPLFGILSDRLNRIDALAISLGIGAIGYGSTFFIDNPFGTGMIVALVFIGMAEVGCIITSGVLVAEQAHENNRGSVIGVFTLTGAVGILVASIVGGQLFDHWMQTGPFSFFGLIAGFVFIWALIVRKQLIPDKTLRHSLYRQTDRAC